LEVGLFSHDKKPRWPKQSWVLAYAMAPYSFTWSEVSWLGDILWHAEPVATRVSTSGNAGRTDCLAFECCVYKQSLFWRNFKRQKRFWACHTQFNR